MNPKVLYPFPSGGSRLGEHQSKSNRNPKGTTLHERQPAPSTPGISKQMVLRHARTLFRDKLPGHQLTLKEWRVVEEDLVHKLEVEAL